jgi:hypothetical protein
MDITVSAIDQSTEGSVEDFLGFAFGREQVSLYHRETFTLRHINVNRTSIRTQLDCQFFRILNRFSRHTLGTSIHPVKKILRDQASTRMSRNIFSRRHTVGFPDMVKKRVGFERAHSTRNAIINSSRNRHNNSRGDKEV